MSLRDYSENNRVPFQHTKWSNKTKRRSGKHQSEEQEQEESSASSIQWKSPPYPVERWGHQAVVLDKYLYLVGGYIEEEHPQAVKEQMYRLDCDTFEWERINCKEGTPVPEHRDSHSMCQLKDQAYLFGGKIGEEQVLNDCWMMQIKKSVPEWVEIKATGQIPPARESAQLCSFYDRYILLFGGTNGKEDDNFVVFDDMYVLDTETLAWKEITDKRGPNLEARDSFGMTEVNGIVYIFGGQGRSVGKEDVFCADFFRLKFTVSAENGEVQFVEIEEIISNHEEKKPCGRASNSICVFKNRFIFIVGGEKGEEIKLDDIWAYDIDENIWIEVQHKRSRPPNLKPLISHSSQVYKENIVVFGGMFKDNNLHSDQTLVLALNYSESDTRKSVSSLPEIRGYQEELKRRISEASFKSAQYDEENILISSKQEALHQQKQSHISSKQQVSDHNQEIKQKNYDEQDIKNRQKTQSNNWERNQNSAQIPEDKIEEAVSEENEDEEEGEHIVLAIGTEVADVLKKEQNYEIIEEEDNQATQNKDNNNNNSNNNHEFEIEIDEEKQYYKDEEKMNEKLEDHKIEDFNQENEEAARESQEKLLKQERDAAQRNRAKKEAQNISGALSQQQILSEEHILHIRQPYVSMSFLSSISSLIASPFTAFGLLAQNAKSQFASTFQINLMITQKKDTYANASISKANTSQQENANNLMNKVNGQLLNKAIDKDAVENNHFFFQIYDDSEGFTHSDFVDLIYKFDSYKAIPYGKSHKELIQDELSLQSKAQYGNNLKMAGLRIGQNILFISKNRAYNILNVGLISSNGKTNPSLQECIIFLFSMDMKRKIYLTENGDQNKRVILNNIAHLMNEEQLFKHDKGNYVYIFDLKRIPQVNMEGYEFQYSPQKPDIVAKKRCVFGEKKDQVERLIDHSLRSYLQHLYSRTPENMHFTINGQRYEFIAYSEILRRQKGMRFLKELNTEVVPILRDLGKVMIYEQVNYNSDSNQSQPANCNNSPTPSDKQDIDTTQIQNEQQKAEGTTTRKNTSAESHQGILIYQDERLIGRAESPSFGAIFIDKILNKTKNQSSLFKFVGIVELDKFFTPNIFHTGLESSFQEDQVRQALKSFIKAQKVPQAVNNKTEKIEKERAEKSEKSEKSEKIRTRSFDNSEEPELKKEIKTD